MQVLVYCFRTLLAIAHPLMPFVTERLWTTLPVQQQQLLIASQWPSHKAAVDHTALAQYQVPSATSVYTQHLPMSRSGFGMPACLWKDSWSRASSALRLSVQA